ERPVALIPEVREKNGRKLALRTQELPELFLPCHPSFYRVHCPAEAIDYGYVFQDWEVSIDIDTYDDLKWCEKMARGFVHDAKRHDVFVNAEVNHFDSKRELYTKSSRM
ncbi:MAG: hypothetical protein KAJ60_10645, partial [Desulfobulbaceae bacterium]|nr:hypothetical protein [Desulfobulbaceae bacterium]